MAHSPAYSLSDRGVEILEGHLMPDHMHMLVSIPLKISVSSFMGYFYDKERFYGKKPVASLPNVMDLS